MTPRNSNSSGVVSPQLWLSAAVLSIATPLVGSSMHAGRFLGSLGQTPMDKAAMLITAGAIITSSVIIGILAGKALARGHHAACMGGIVVWLGILAFSTSTSTLAILNTSGEKIASQVASGSESQAVQASITANIATIKSLQAQIDARDPVRWATRRAEWAGEIQDLQAQNQSYLRMAQSIDARSAGSVVGQSFQQLEKYGITRLRLSVLVSLLLDAIPFVTSILIGALAESRREAAPRKKPQARPHLKAVG